MSELRYPNESKAYRDARDALLKDEQELIDKMKAVAAKRRKLPDGGQLKEDYVFQWANDGQGRTAREVLRAVRREEFVAALLIHVRPKLGQAVSVLHVADGWVRPDLVLGRQDAAFAAIAKAPAEKINAWAKERGWSQIPLLSGYELTFQKDYKCQGETDDMQLAVMHAFRKRDGKIFHFWGAETMRTRRYGVAVLESDGLHAGGPAGP